MEAFNDYTGRFLATIEAMGLKDSEVVNALEDLSKGTMSKIRNARCGVSMNTLQDFCLAYPNVNSNYIITGNGDMFLDSETHQVTNKPMKGSVPFYKELPVSAGKMEILKAFVDKEEGQGWIKLPKVSAIAAFPVTGCSMKPYINDGDFVAIAPVERWENVDPEKIYLIITRDDRMIKHLVKDEEDDSFLWAMSPNFPRFRVFKNEIVEIYRVVFYGRMA